MRSTAAWILLALLVGALSACGRGGHEAPETQPAVEGAVEHILEALARGDTDPIVEAQDLREHYAALPAAERDATSFDAFAVDFRASCAIRAASAYTAGESRHQVVGHYDDAGRTVVKVRFQRHASAHWVEWDLPFRFIDGAWRMGLGGLNAMDGSSSAPSSDEELLPPPDAILPPPELLIPLPDPVSVPPVVDAETNAELEELAELRRFLAKGGNVDERFDDGSLLGWPAFGHGRLHVAAENGWLEVAALLIEHGADTKAIAQSKSHYNQLTPLDVARHAGHPEMVALLEGGSRETREAVKELVLVFPAPKAASALVTFDTGEIRVITEDTFGKEVEADLFLDPGDPEILALTSSFEGLTHRGDDAAVAIHEGTFDDLNQVPRTAPAWRDELARSSIRPGAVFLVRSSSGTIYKVEIRQYDVTAVKLRYAHLAPRDE